MGPIKDFKLSYEAANKQNTFAAGDVIKGSLSFILTEDIQIKSLYVKVKGDANVHWSEKHGEHHTHHSRHQRFYKAKEFLVPESKDETVLQRGDHHYPFKLKIPEGNIPPSFHGYYGKIVHVLQAYLKRSWHASNSDQHLLNFVSRMYLPAVQSPQAGSVDKKVGTFSKGKVHLSATVDKRVYSPGDIVHVTAKIKNKSSKKMRIKYSIYHKVVYRAYHHAKIQSGTVCKIAGESIEPDFEGDVSCSITIPPDTKLSIHNCEIINVEFYLKAYLDVSFALDPEVSLPLIIASPDLNGHHGYQNAHGPIGGPSSSDFPPIFSGPYPVGPPNAYPAPAPNQYPMCPAGYNPVPGYNSQMPLQPGPYGYPTAPVMAYPPSQYSMDTQAPPSYTSIYPNPHSGKDMEDKTQF